MGLYYFDKIFVPNALSWNDNPTSYYVGGVFANEENVERLMAVTLGVLSINPIALNSKKLFIFEFAAKRGRSACRGGESQFVVMGSHISAHVLLDLRVSASSAFERRSRGEVRDFSYTSTSPPIR